MNPLVLRRSIANGNDAINCLSCKAISYSNDYGDSSTRELACGEFWYKARTLEEGKLVAQKEDSHKKFNLTDYRNEKKRSILPIGNM